MKMVTHPPDIQQIVGILLSVFGIVLGLAVYFGGLHALSSQYGGDVLSEERHLLAFIGGGIGLAFLAIAYSFSRD